MYHSFDTTAEETSDFPLSKKRLSFRNSLSGSFYKNLDPQQARERHQRRLLMGCEKLLSARLTIDEVHLSLNSKLDAHHDHGSRLLPTSGMCYE